jgi:hypothetical protein
LDVAPTINTLERCCYSGLLKIGSLRALEHGVSGEGRDRSWNVGGGRKRHDGDHGKTSVVQFSVFLDLHCAFIDSGEVNWWEDDGGGVSSLGVVNSIGLTDDLRKKDQSNDLALAYKSPEKKQLDKAYLNGKDNRRNKLDSLTSFRDGVPGIEGLQGGQGFERNILAEHTGEVDSSSLDKVSSGGKHSNTGVLELGSTEPGKGLIGSKGSKAQRIEGLQRHSVSCHVTEGHTKSRRRLLRSRRERSSAGGKSENESGNLHHGDNNIR